MNGRFKPGSARLSYASAQERGEMKPHIEWSSGMRVKVLILALVAAIVALPVPASQLLSGPSSASAPGPHAIVVPGTGNLGLLLQDPFLIDALHYEAPKSPSVGQ